MKKTYLSLVVGMAALVSLAVYFLANMEKRPMEPDLTLRVSSPFLSHDLSYYDPLAARAGHQFCVTDALFSKLVEFGPDDRIRASLATSFQIRGPDEIEFEIGDRIKTTGGHTITALDVAFSLKRLILTPNAFAHDIQDLIRGCKDIKHPDDECPGIVVEGNKVILGTEIYPALVLESLASTAYSIVPRSIVKKVPSEEKWEIADFSETGGTYYFDRIDDSGYIHLVANRNHFAYHPRMPQRLIFVGTTDFDKSRPNHVDSLGQFLRREVDQIPTLGNLFGADREALLGNKTLAMSVHATHPLRISTAKFTRAGRKLPKKERLALARKIRIIMKEDNAVMNSSSELTDQYIPEPGFGSLDKKRIEEYLKSLEDEIHETSGKGVRIEWFSYIEQELKDIFVKHLPDLEFVPVGKNRVSSTDRTKTEDKDIILANEMPGVNESYSSISWAINAEVFPLSEEEGKKWLSEYVKTESWEKRREMYRDLHWKSLAEDPTIIPISRFPFYAFTHKPWTTPFPKFYSSNPFYLMRYGDE